jgi:hypothetical protein
MESGRNLVPHSFVDDDEQLQTNLTHIMIEGGDFTDLSDTGNHYLIDSKNNS